MLVYDKLYILLEKNGIKKSSLRNHGFSPKISVKLSKGEDVSTDTINRICKLLNCQPCDIMEYIPDKIDSSNEPDIEFKLRQKEKETTKIVSFNDITAREIDLILAYRQHPECQTAIDRMLGIKPTESDNGHKANLA